MVKKFQEPEVVGNCVEIEISRQWSDDKCMNSQLLQHAEKLL